MVMILKTIKQKFESQRWNNQTLIFQTIIENEKKGKKYRKRKFEWIFQYIVLIGESSRYNWCSKCWLNHLDPIVIVLKI